MHDIILGRSKSENEKYGTKGSVFIGKQYVQMGDQFSLSNPIHLDVSRAHAMLVLGKRGGGKCVLGNTEVTLADNSKKTIEEIFNLFLKKINKVERNDETEEYVCDKKIFIKTFNEKTHSFEDKNITNVYRRKINEEVIKWKIGENKNLITTTNHRILFHYEHLEQYDDFNWYSYEDLINEETGSNFCQSFVQYDKNAKLFSTTFSETIDYEEKDFEKIKIPFEGYVYDIAVEENHNFIANDIVIHNSYTMGSIAEGLADMDPEVSKNLAFMMLDTMGVYWSMKYPNKKDDSLLKKWGLEGKGLGVQIYVPGGFYNKYKEDGIPVDFPLYIQPKELSVEDWMNAFKLKTDDEVGVALQRVINKLLDSKVNFEIDDILKATDTDDKLDSKTKLAVINRFENTKTWGLFSKNGTPIKDIFVGGKVTVIDLSPYVALPGGWEVKALALGIIAKKVFVERMLVRKREEIFDIVNKTQVVKQEEVKEDLPMPWLIVDECLTGDSLIQTNQGNVQIGDIIKSKNKEKYEVLSFNDKMKTFEYQPITQIFDQGEKEIIQIKTQLKQKINCTPNHKIYSRKGFIEAKNAKEIGTPLIKGYDKTKNKVIGRIIGHIYGDGWISTNGEVGFSSDNEEDLKLIKNDLTLLGFKSSSIQLRETTSKITNYKSKTSIIKGSTFSFKSSKKLHSYLKELGILEGSKVNQNTQIPKCVAKDKEISCEFLASLFGADANIPSISNKWKSDFNPIRLVFYRKEELKNSGVKYAESIEKLLKKHNVLLSSIKIRKGNIRVDGSKSIRFEMTIAKEINNMINFFEKIGYKYCKRKELEGNKWLYYLNYKLNAIKIKEKKKQETFKLKKKGLGNTEISKKLLLPLYQIKEWVQKDSSISLGWKFQKFDAWVKENISNELLFDEIISKKKLRKERVFDIEVKKNHNFVANNMLVHNCHEFLPAGDEDAPSKQALMTILREGRQPGVSIIMATQQPAKIHTDAITQSDIVMAHRLTASFDLEALDKVFLSYNNKGSKALFNAMPRTKGCAIIMDDKNERLHTMQVKPRTTWHGGEDPNAIREVKEEFDFD